MIALALHDAGSYNGFRYLDGYPCPDVTRVAYYPPKER